LELKKSIEVKKNIQVLIVNGAAGTKEKKEISRRNRGRAGLLKQICGEGRTRSSSALKA
jgi:hypothetical protein